MMLRLRPPPPLHLPTSVLPIISTSTPPLNSPATSPRFRRRWRRPLPPIATASKPLPIGAAEPPATAAAEDEQLPVAGEEGVEQAVVVGVGSPSLPARVGMAREALGDHMFFLLAFVAVTTSVAFTSMVAVAIPTLLAMRRAAISFTKLADTTLEELPSTMAAVRLSGMEISDLTLELSDLSQEIAAGVNKSAKVVQAAEAGVKQMGTVARQQTLSMIGERANLPDIPIKPVVAGAARKTSHVVGQATKSLMNLLSRDEKKSKEQMSDRVQP